MTLTNRKTFWILVAIILLGTFLRFHNLDGESMWNDEGATTLAMQKHGPFGIVKKVIDTGNILPEYYPQWDDELPLYYVFLGGWVEVFGQNDYSFRAFSALTGILALIIIFYLVRLIYGTNVALIATFFSSINLTLILYSQEARQYSYLLFLSVLSVFLLVKYLKEKRTSFLVLFLMVNAIIIYSHLPWAMLMFLEGLYVLMILIQEYHKKKTIDYKLVVVFLIMGILYLPLIGRMLFGASDLVDLYGRPSLRDLTEFGVRTSTWIYPTVDLREKIYASSFDFSVIEWIHVLSAALLALLLPVFFLWGCYVVIKKKKRDLLLLLMFFTPIIFSLLVSYFHSRLNIFELKQMIYIIPAFLIIASIPIAKSRFKVSFIILITILTIPPLAAYYVNLDKQQFREAAEFLPQNEDIFVFTPTAQVTFQYYYGEKMNVRGINNLEELKQVVGERQSFWMVFTLTKYKDPKGTLRDYLDSHFKVTEKKDFFDIEIIHYEKP